MVSALDFGLKHAIRFDIGRAVKEARAHLDEVKARYADAQTLNAEDSETEMLEDAQLIKQTLKALLKEFNQPNAYLDGPKVIEQIFFCT